MPSLQSAKNAYIAQNQNEIQYQYHHQQQQQQQQAQKQNPKQQQQQQQTSPYKANPSTSNSIQQKSSQSAYATGAAPSKMQSKPITNEIVLNKTENNSRNQKTQPNRLNDENAMNNANFVKRGNLYGPIYDVDHLATFTVGTKQGLIKAEDGMRKLRLMEKSQGIWTMECQLMIDSNFLVVYDKKNGQEIEMFPLSLLNDPTSVVSDDKKDIYNNILLFTVIEDVKKKTGSTAPSEMHIFQCLNIHSAEIVDEIYRAKEGRRNQPSNGINNKHILNYNEQAQHPKHGYHVDDNNNSNGRSLNRVALGASSNQTRGENGIISPAKIDMEVQILNHCFDDIERFVTRLQNSSEYFKELERRQKQHKSPKKAAGDGMLGLRAQMPPPQQYIDIFQKFKYSFNLLAKLKAHIHDPNAPELIHFLFTPLSLIVNTTKEQPYRGLAKTAWLPLLTKETKELLLNCLTSKEQDLWLSLGDAWTVTREEAKLQPKIYSHLDNQVYNPVFYDGWSPAINQSSDVNDNRNDISRLAFDTAAQVQAQAQAHQAYQSKQPQQLPIQKSRYYINTQPQLDSEPAPLPPSNSTSLNRTSHQLQQSQQQYKYNGQLNQQVETRSNSSNNNNINHHNAGSYSSNQNSLQNGNAPSKHIANGESTSKLVNIRNYDEMKKWAIDLAYRGAKVYEVTHDRQGNNDKELTIKAGELLEVLDDKRNWWRLRNFYGNIGHAPVTILRPFEFSSMPNGNHPPNYDSEKVGYF